MGWVAAIGLGVLGACCGAGWWMARRRNMHLWMGGYARSVVRGRRRRGAEEGPTDVFLAVCDHFEPQWGRPARHVADERVRRWVTEYRRLFEGFQDSDGRPPQHTFFFPQDEYEPAHVERLAELCRAGFGDVEIHLHHDGDTRESLREKLESFRDELFERHGLLRRDSDGRVVYGFIHGNWALCNSRPDGRWCGVDDEILVLKETGCYADFTMPSAPDITQARIVNSIYYARNRAGCSKSHDQGTPARVGTAPPADGLLMIQGPLMLDWRRRKWGMLPRIENADVHASNPATMTRLRMWLEAGVQVEGRPDWYFVKLHTHGAKDGNIDTLLGEPMVAFHRALGRLAKENPLFRFHYVTAWEMAELVHQAERGEDLPGRERGVVQGVVEMV